MISAYLEKSGVIFAILLAAVLPISTSLTIIFFALAIVLYYASGHWKEKYQLIQQNKIALIFLVFFLMFIIGLSYSEAPLPESLKLLGKYAKILLAVLLFPIFVDEKNRRYAIILFFVTMVVIVLLSYLKYYFGLPINMHLPGQSTVFKSHILAGYLMALTAYLSAHWMFMYKRYWVLFALLFVLISYNLLFMSIGRSGYFVYFAFMLLFFWQKLNWRGLLVAVLVGSVLVSSAFLFSDNFRQRMLEIGENIVSYKSGDIDTSVGLRIEFVKHSFHLFKQHPIIGTGTGSFKNEYAKIDPPPFLIIDNPHNEYLYIAVQFGLIGLLLLILMYYWQWHESFKLKDNERHLAQAIVLAMVVGCLANSWIKDNTEGYLYGYMIALTFASLTIRKRTKNEHYA